jgi:nitrous oxidase accessory protein NosD
MGVYLDLGSEGNTIYGNTFLANVHNAHSVTANRWDCDGTGNYWYDYVGVDADENGIGDAPYVIRSQGDQDNFPLLRMP